MAPSAQEASAGQQSVAQEQEHRQYHEQANADASGLRPDQRHAAPAEEGRALRQARLQGWAATAGHR